MKVGDLIKFKRIYEGCYLNGATAIFLGEHNFRWEKGKKFIITYKILLLGYPTQTLIDETLLTYMEVINEV